MSYPGGVGVIRLGACSLLAVAALLSVFRVPVGFLWKPAVAATEWGHVLVLASLLLAVPGGRNGVARWSLILSIGSAVVLSNSLVRATAVARTVPSRVEEVFGSTPPASRPGAPARTRPLGLKGLLGIASPEVEVSRHDYVVRGEETLQLDLYRPTGVDETLPGVVLVHGGSWNKGDRTQIPAVNRYLAARGIAVAAIDYRLAPEHVFPAARDDVLAAADFLRGNPDLLVDPERIVLMGRSAGGHLALSAGYHQAGFRGVVAYYPPSDMNWSWEHPTNPWVVDTPRTLSDFLGGSPADRPDNYRAASPYHFVSADSPPTLLIHGGRDELVFAEQTRRFADALERAGVPHLYLELPWATHGFDGNFSGPGNQIALYALERFLARAFE